MFIVESMRSLVIMFSIAFNVTTGRPGVTCVYTRRFFQFVAVGRSIELAQIFTNGVLICFVAVKIHAVGEPPHEIHHGIHP